MKLPKLVRNNIPDTIDNSGKCSITYKAASKDLNYFLIEKMKEELKEFQATPCLEEAADMYEVFLTILDHWSLDLDLVKSVAEIKRNINGSFKEGIILENITH